MPHGLACSTARLLLPLRVGPVMKVSSPMTGLHMNGVDEVPYLPEAICDGAGDEFDQAKAAVEVGAADVGAQVLRFGKGLRPLRIVHIDLTPRRSKKYHGRVVARGCSPGIRCALPPVTQVADQIRQAAIEETSPAGHAVRQLRTHSRAAFLCESP